MPKNLCMCINFSKPGVLSKPFPILSRWNEGSSEKKTGTSCLLTESQPFYLLLSTSPAVNIFASKTETHGRDIEKNEIKTVPENLGHMFSRTVAIQDCVSCRCLISVCINNHSSISKGIVNFFIFSSKNLICS